MPNTVNQPSKAPTRKLSAAVIISAAMGWGSLAVQNYAPGWYDAAVWTNTELLLMAVIGYFFVRDRPNR